MKDYNKEAVRQAYSKGVISRINALQAIDNPYPIAAKELHLAWMRGWSEKGSIKDRTR